MNRKLKAGRRNRRTERQRVWARPHAFRGARTGRHGGRSPARSGCRGPAPAASSSRSRPRRALLGGRRPPLPQTGVSRSPGPARLGVERSGRRAGGQGRRAPRAGDARVPSGMGLCTPVRAPLPAPGPRTDERTAGRRGRRRPPARARAPLALPRAGLGEGDGGAPAEPGLAWCPPSRGDRGLSSLLRLLKSSFPGESGDVRGPASRWRGCLAGEAASSYPITDCQSRRPSPHPPGGGQDPGPPPCCGPT